MKCKKGFKRVKDKCVKVKPKVNRNVIIRCSDNRPIEIGFTSALTLLFITLKLIGTISWSWWWVLSPVWISLGVGLIIILIVWTIIRRDF